MILDFKEYIENISKELTKNQISMYHIWICTMYTYDENVHKRIVNITNEQKLSKHCFDLNSNQPFRFQPVTYWTM